MPSPDITVVIACRDEMRSLPACLDALDAQDLPRGRAEIFLVDGGSTDGCADLARRRGVTLLHDKGQGPAAARNVGIRAARGDVVAFTDADCVPRFDWLSRIHEAFQDPAVHGVAGGLRMSRATLVGRLEDNDARLCYAGYITSNVAYRREVLLDVGGFDEALRCAEDFDLAWRVLDAGYRIEHVPGAVVLHDPPEVQSGLRAYLAKQFWYARWDVLAQARAIARGTETGSALARAGLVSALGWSSLLVGAAAGLALRSPLLVAGTFGAVAVSSARHVARSLRERGEGELIPMAAIETVRRSVRGAGTIAGLVTTLARPSRWRGLSGGPLALAAGPRPAARASPA